MSLLLYRIRVYLMNNWRELLGRLLLLLMLAVGVVGVWLQIESGNAPKPIPITIYQSACDLQPKTILTKEEIEKCLRPIVVYTEPSLRDFNPNFSITLPDVPKFIVLSQVIKGRPVSGGEFAPYIGEERVVLVEMSLVHAHANRVHIHIRDENILARLVSTSPETETGEATVIQPGTPFQLHIVGRCAALIENRCAFVAETGEVLDVDGKPINQVAKETIYAVLEKFSSEGGFSTSTPAQPTGTLFISPAEGGTR